MKIIFWSILGIILVAGLMAGGWLLGHQSATYDPYQDLNATSSSRHEFLVKSSEVSVKMAARAIEALKSKDVAEAIEDCKIAIDIFPPDTKPYILLTKLYLMMGQEEKMYDTLTLSGHSYPNFDNILETIDDVNLDKIPLAEPQGNIYLANFPENKKMAVSFMFDDGEANVYKALPTFEKYGYRATIPVVAGFVAENSNDPFWGSWAEWKDAAARGFEIANHSMYHRDHQKLHGVDLDISIDHAKAKIEQRIAHKVTAYVFPHDSYSDESVSYALREHEVIRTSGFLRSFYIRTVDVVIGGPHVSIKTANRLIDIGIKRHLWLVDKCHGVSEKRTMRSFKSITPDFLESHLAYIHSKADEVWVDTFSHVFEYLAARAKAKIETKNLGADSLDFVLHSDQLSLKPAVPITVVVKLASSVKVITASVADGHALKAWSCGADLACVDVDAYDQNIHLHWSNS